LGSLRITKEDASEEMIEYTDEMLVVSAPATIQSKQAIMPKSIVLNPEWLGRDRIKFKD